MSMLRTQLRAGLQEIVDSMGIVDVSPQIDTPSSAAFGDYTSNIAMVVAKKLGQSPREVAQQMQQELLAMRGQLSLEKVDIAGPGFLNFWVSKEALLQTTREIENVGQGKPVVVEYSSPNIAKPFTIGHLRSTIIGDAIANLLEAVGYKVFRDNHLGDWGTQFGKQIYALIHLGEGSLEKNLAWLEKSDRPVQVLVQLYVEFHEKAETNPAMEDEAREWFKKLENGDQEARDLWQKCIDWSWKEFNAIYEKLGVLFTENDGRGYGESFFEDKMTPVIAELEAKKMLQEGKEGAKLVFFPEEKKMPALMIVKKDGASLYATRDLATDKFRLEKYGKDVVVINEVGAEQSLYWEQVYTTEYMLGWYQPGQRIHIKHGMYRFKEGKMSTRKGNVIWLEDVLEEAVERAKKLGEETAQDGLAEMVAVGAIKWNDLKRDAKQDIAFDWDDILNMQGNSGPYLQYTYARTQSVIRKAGNQYYQLVVSGQLLVPEELQLLRTLAKFAEIVVDAAEKYSPNILCTYLFNLAQEFNLFYQKCPILREADEVKWLRLALTATVGQTLHTGLNLLGIEAPERM